MFHALFFVYSWFIFLPMTVASTLFFAVVCLVLLPFLGPRRVARVTAVPWARLGLLLSGVQIRIEGREHLRPGQSYVIVANHLSQFDIWVLYGYLGTDFRWVMKQEMRRVPVIGYCCARLGHIFIDRRDHQSAIASLAQAERQLADGTSILFFPEGTRSRSGTLQTFKKGAFRMAQDLDLPLLPVTITGTHDILPPDTLRLQPGIVDLTLHPPITIEGRDEASLTQALQRSRAAIASVTEPGPARVV